MVDRMIFSDFLDILMSLKWLAFDFEALRRLPEFCGIFAKLTMPALKGSFRSLNL